MNVQYLGFALFIVVVGVASYRIGHMRGTVADAKKALPIIIALTTMSKKLLTILKKFRDQLSEEDLEFIADVREGVGHIMETINDLPDVNVSTLNDED